MVQEDPGLHVISRNKGRLGGSASTSAEGEKRLRLDSKSVEPDVETVRNDAKRTEFETSSIVTLEDSDSAAGPEQQAHDIAGDEVAHDESHHIPVPNRDVHESAEPLGGGNARTRRPSSTVGEGHPGQRGRGRASEGDSIKATMTAIHSWVFARPPLQEIYKIQTLYDGWVQNFGLKSFLSLPWQKSASDGECAEFIQNYAHPAMCTTVRGVRIDLSSKGLAAAFKLKRGSVKLRKTMQYNSENFPESAQTRDGYKTKQASDQWVDRYTVMLSLFFLKPVHRDVSRGLVSWMEARGKDKDLATVFHSCFRREMHRLWKSKAANCEGVTTHIGPHVHILIHGTGGESLQVDKAVMNDNDGLRILQVIDGIIDQAGNIRAEMVALWEQNKHMKANEKRLEAQLLEMQSQPNAAALKEQLRVVTIQLQKKDTTIDKQAEDLWVVTGQLQEKDATINEQAEDLRALTVQLQEKDAALNDRAEELGRMTAKLERQNTTFLKQMNAKDAQLDALSSMVSDLEADRDDLTRRLHDARVKTCRAVTVPP